MDVINHLAVSLDIDYAMDSVRKACLELLDCDHVTLYLIFEKQKELRHVNGRLHVHAGLYSVLHQSMRGSMQPYSRLSLVAQVEV